MALQEKTKLPTIYDVAKLAGVSPITVSRAFSRKLPVSENARKKIFAVADRLKFRPSPLASGLNGGKTNCISIIWSQGLPILPQKVLTDLARKAQEKQFCLQLIVYTEEFNDIIKECLLRAIDAVILCVPSTGLNNESFALLKQFHAAVLIVDSPVNRDFDQIIWNRTPAVTDAVAYLKKNGKRKPCVLMEVAGNKLKVDAFFNAALDNGFAIEKSSIIDLPQAFSSDIEKFELFFEKFLNENKFAYAAILFSCDEMAAIAMRLLQEKGYSVPNQIAVIGFNDDTIARAVSPKLATVNRNHEDLAQQMNEMIFARLEDPGIEPQLRTVDMKFVLRESAIANAIV